jgi:hypothetical protein
MFVLNGMANMDDFNFSKEKLKSSMKCKRHRIARKGRRTAEECGQAPTFSEEKNR